MKTVFVLFHTIYDWSISIKCIKQKNTNYSITKMAILVNNINLMKSMFVISYYVFDKSLIRLNFISVVSLCITNSITK